MGSTDNFFPGSWNAAAAEVDSCEAAAVPEAAAAEGDAAELSPSAVAIGEESVGAEVAVAVALEVEDASVETADEPYNTN